MSTRAVEVSTLLKMVHLLAEEQGSLGCYMRGLIAESMGGVPPTPEEIVASVQFEYRVEFGSIDVEWSYVSKAMREFVGTYFPSAPLP